MTVSSSLLTVDSNVIIAALRGTEPKSQRCRDIMKFVPHQFLLAEPSIIYQEVCGTIARKVGIETANAAKRHLDTIIDSQWLATCDKKVCIAAAILCASHKIYAIDALYLHVALTYGAVLVSLDGEFIDGLNREHLPIDAYTVDNFPY